MTCFYDENWCTLTIHVLGHRTFKFLAFLSLAPKLDPVPDPQSARRFLSMVSYYHAKFHVEV